MSMLTLIAILFAAGYADLGSGDHRRTVSLAGEKRSYLVHVPPQYDPAKSIPMVLAFHGGGANAENMVTFSGLNETADNSGFIVVYPDGSGRLQRMLTFNAGNCCGNASSSNVDGARSSRRCRE